MLIKIQPDATVCRYLFTVKSLYMFRVSQHPSSGVLKTVTATSGTGHNTGTATSLQRGLIDWIVMHGTMSLKFKSLPSRFYTQPCSFALLVFNFSTAFLCTSQKCELWPISKTNDRHISSIYLRPHVKRVCVIVVAFAVVVVFAVVQF